MLRSTRLLTINSRPVRPRGSATIARLRLHADLRQQSALPLTAGTSDDLLASLLLREIPPGAPRRKQ